MSNTRTIGGDCWCLVRRADCARWHACYVLEMKANCERCSTDLPADQAGAFICSYECTWCAPCADELKSCPNCNGELLARPTRTTH